MKTWMVFSPRGKNLSGKILTRSFNQSLRLGCADISSVQRGVVLGASAPRFGVARRRAIFVTAAQSDRKQRDEIVLPYSVSAVKFLGERETWRKIEIARTHSFPIVSAAATDGKVLNDSVVRSFCARKRSRRHGKITRMTREGERERGGGGGRRGNERLRPRYGNTNFVRGINFRNKRCQEINGKARARARETSLSRRSY